MEDRSNIVLLHTGNKRGIIGKAVVLQSQKNSKTELMGVAVCGDDRVNFTLQYDWPSLDMKGFLDDLRDKLAKDLDIPASQMDVRDRELLGLMEQMHYRLHGQNVPKKESGLVDHKGESLTRH